MKARTSRARIARVLSWTALTATVGIVLAGCAAPAGGGSDAVQKLIDKGTVQMGVANAKPSSYLTPSGKVAGVEPDIATAVLKKMGIKTIKGVQVDFSAMIPGLQAGQFDLLAGALLMKQSRCKAVLFSEPTMVSTYVLLTRTDLAGKRPVTLKDVADSNLKLGVQSGTVQDALATSVGITGNRHLALPDLSSVVDALKTGRVDVVLDVGTEIEGLIGKDPKGLVIGPPASDVPVTGSGVAFKLGQEKLRDAFNKQLKKLKDDGEFSKISKSYGVDPTPALTATTAQLCKTAG